MNRKLLLASIVASSLFQFSQASTLICGEGSQGRGISPTKSSSSLHFTATDFHVVNEQDSYLPSGYNEVEIEVRHGHGTGNIYLPENPKDGDFVKVDHQANATKVRTLDENLIDTIDHEIGIFVYINNAWIRDDYYSWVERFDDRNKKKNTLVELDLNNSDILPLEVVSTSVSALGESFRDIKKEVYHYGVYLDDSGYLSNTSPLFIHELDAELSGSPIRLKFDSPIPPYTKVSLDSISTKNMVITNHQLFDRLLFTTDAFEDSEIIDDGEHRELNASEKEMMEAYTYLRSAAYNHPSGLSKTINYFKQQCQEYSECLGYENNYIDYAQDTYFVSSASSLNRAQTFKISYGPNSGSFEGAASVGNHRSYIDAEVGFGGWSTYKPRVLTKDYSSTFGVIHHEISHIKNFSHNSGWTYGISDTLNQLFNNKYTESILKRNRLISDMSLQAERIDLNHIRFKVFSLNPQKQSKIRLYSTEKIDAKIIQNEDGIDVKFNRYPSGDIYVSVFNDDSKQMASYIIKHDEFPAYDSSTGKEQIILKRYDETTSNYVYYTPQEAKQLCQEILDRDLGVLHPLHSQEMQDFQNRYLEYGSQVGLLDGIPTAVRVPSSYKLEQHNIVDKGQVVACGEPLAPVFVADNGVTLKASGFAEVGERYEYNGSQYLVVDNNMLRKMNPETDDFEHIITTHVTDMSWLFNAESSFDQNISSWDVSNVTNMAGMFIYAENFNQDLSAWNVSKVTSMEKMFKGATSFKQDIGMWKTSSLIDTSWMFQNSNFNSPLNDWDVSNVTNMAGMFIYAGNFNQDLSNWNVSKVTSMEKMFKKATSFNQDISMWAVDSVVNSSYFAIDSPIDGTSKVPNF